MLSDRQKEKIIEEETFLKDDQAYRKEVKKTLGTFSNENTLTGFLNSSFGIWLLSTIVVGVFTYTFNQYNLGHKEVEVRNTQIHQLDIEIESRISQFWVNLFPLVRKSGDTFVLKDGTQFDTVKVLWQVFKNAPSNNSRLSYSIYKEYESRNTISLMAELWRLLEDKYKVETEFADDIVNTDTSRTIAIKALPRDKVKPYTQISAIEKAIVFISTDGIFESMDKPTPIKKIWENFSKNIIHNRWYIFFPYTDSLFG